jgi:hypothetical protein
MNDVIKGKVKAKIGDTLIIRDPQISNIIKDALVDKGFDLIIRPTINPVTRYFEGEEIEIFRETK